MENGVNQGFFGVAGFDLLVDEMITFMRLI